MESSEITDVFVVFLFLALGASVVVQLGVAAALARSSVSEIWSFSVPATGFVFSLMRWLLHIWRKGHFVGPQRYPMLLVIEENRRLGAAIGFLFGAVLFLGLYKNP